MFSVGYLDCVSWEAFNIWLASSNSPASPRKSLPNGIHWHFQSKREFWL